MAPAAERKGAVIARDEQRAVKEPWRYDASAVAAELATDIGQGLSSDEAAARREREGPNEISREAPVPRWRRFLAQFQDPLIYLLIAATAISILAWVLEGAEGIPYDAVVIVAIVLLNAVLGFVQEE